MTAQQKTLQVAVSTGTPVRDFHKLAPQGELRWGRCEFVLNPDNDTKFDYWIVFATAPGKCRLRVAPVNTLFIAGEPPEKKIYPRGFYQQFHRLICSKGEYPHDRICFDALGLNWHVGHDRISGEYRYGYDELSTMGPADKQLAISVICSDLHTTPGQRARLHFLEQIKPHFGDRLVHYGRGFLPIEDKMEGIAPFYYHLVLENSISDDYWTEKLADAYLGWSFPLYVGCSNLSRYFPETSFCPLDMDNVASAISTMEQALTTPPSARQHAALAEARQRILNRYNPFARFSYWAERFYSPHAMPETHVILPHKAFAKFPVGALYRYRKRYW